MTYRWQYLLHVLGVDMLIYQHLTVVILAAMAVWPAYAVHAGWPPILVRTCAVVAAMNGLQLWAVRQTWLPSLPQLPQYSRPRAVLTWICERCCTGFCEQVLEICWVCRSSI